MPAAEKLAGKIMPTSRQGRGPNSGHQAGKQARVKLQRLNRVVHHGVNSFSEINVASGRGVWSFDPRARERTWTLRIWSTSTACRSLRQRKEVGRLDSGTGPNRRRDCRERLYGGTRTCPANVHFPFNSRLFLSMPLG